MRLTMMRSLVRRAHRHRCPECGYRLAEGRCSSCGFELVDRTRDAMRGRDPRF
jgi:ribosomal protein L37E